MIQHTSDIEITIRKTLHSWTSQDSLEDIQWQIAIVIWLLGTKLDTVWCSYNTVSFIQNSQNRCFIPCLAGWGMGCLLWVWSLIYVLLLSSQCHMCYHDKLDHVIMALYCICLPKSGILKRVLRIFSDMILSNKNLYSLPLLSKQQCISFNNLTNPIMCWWYQKAIPNKTYQYKYHSILVICFTFSRLRKT